MPALPGIVFSLILLAVSGTVMGEGVSKIIPSVQDNIAAMDKDADGMVTVFEVRAFIETTHGKAYQTAVLDAMESAASGKSCGTPFAGIMY